MQTIQLCKPLPGIANLIALMAITKICPAYNNPVRRKIHLWKSGHVVYMSIIPETHWSRSSGPPSMIKSSKWRSTACYWNGPPPDTIKPGRTQLSKCLPNIKKKAFTKYWSGENKNHLIRLEKQMKQETRVDFNSYMHLMDILDPATDFNAKRFYAYVKCKKKYSM